MANCFSIWIDSGWVTSAGMPVLYRTRTEAERDLKDFAVDPVGYEVRPFNISEYYR